jgi:hypothetical protein
MYADKVPQLEQGKLSFWERRLFVALVTLLAMVPLVAPEVPPLLDLPGHIGRYRVQLDLANSPALQQFYSFEWRLIGNLGVDLLVQLLAPLLGLELAVKLIVMAIPGLTVAGFLWVAREVHGRVPPTALFAVPFAYNFPFLFGFVNFALAMALALLAFALWLRLGRLGHPWIRAAVFVPISVVLWVAHAFGWGTLGVLAFSAELVRQHDKGRSIFVAPFRAGIHCLSLIPPMALMLLWRSNAAGETSDWFNWDRKWDWLTMALRDRWELFDIASVGLAALIFAGTLFVRRMHYSRNLLASTLFLIAVFILLPRIVFGSAYADMRLAPYLFAIALLSIRPGADASRRLTTGLAVAGLAFAMVRIGANTVSMQIYDNRYDRELAALEHVPHGARMVSFVGRPCVENWAMTRLLHLPAMAIVRRHAFSNDQWTMAGAQLLQVRYREGWPFVVDATQIVTARRCPREYWRPVNIALAVFPRDGFDYVWLIDPPRHDPRMTEGLRPIWRSGTSVLYRVERSAKSETPAGIGTLPTM